jgi:hypothetical protein
MNGLTRLGLVAGALLVAASIPGTASADCGGDLARLRPAAFVTHGDATQPSIVGLWKVTLTSAGVVVDIGFDAWHADGTETLNDASPVSHNVCLGVWTHIGRRTFQLKHPAFRYDAAGNVIGTLVLREINTVNRAGDRFTGTFSIEFFDPNGVSIFKGEGEITGERVTVDD